MVSFNTSMLYYRILVQIHIKIDFVRRTCTMRRMKFQCTRCVKVSLCFVYLIIGWNVAILSVLFIHFNIHMQYSIFIILIIIFVWRFWLIYSLKFTFRFSFHFFLLYDALLPLNAEQNHVYQLWPDEKRTLKMNYKMPLKRSSVENLAPGELLFFMVYRDRLYETKSINWLWSKNGKQIC